MGTLDELFDKAKVVADAATKMTGEVVEISKNKLHAFKINTNIQKAYEKLGAAVYDAQKNGTDINETVAVCIAEIDGLLAQLKEINDRMGDSKVVLNCSQCGYGNAPDALYCAHCGIKTPQGNATAVQNYVE